MSTVTSPSVPAAGRCRSRPLPPGAPPAGHARPRAGDRRARRAGRPARRFAALEDNPAQAVTDAVSSYGLAVLVPLATLWLGTAAIGDLVEDRLLVYIWLKPCRGGRCRLAAVLATATVVVPLAVVPVAVSAVVAGAGQCRCRRVRGCAAGGAGVLPGCSWPQASGSSAPSGGAWHSSSWGEPRRQHLERRCALHGGRLGGLRPLRGRRRRRRRVRGVCDSRFHHPAARCRGGLPGRDVPLPPY